MNFRKNLPSAFFTGLSGMLCFAAFSTVCGSQSWWVYSMAAVGFLVGLAVGITAD